MFPQIYSTGFTFISIPEGLLLCSSRMNADNFNAFIDYYKNIFKLNSIELAIGLITFYKRIVINT